MPALSESEKDVEMVTVFVVDIVRWVKDEVGDGDTLVDSLSEMVEVEVGVAGGVMVAVVEIESVNVSVTVGVGGGVTVVDIDGVADGVGEPE